MNIIEELQSLDINDIGRWPLVFRVAVIAIVFVIVLGPRRLLGHHRGQGAAPETCPGRRTNTANYFRKQAKESGKLRRRTARSCYRWSSHFGTMLRQLPGETEIPSLIVDISQTGLAAGLQEKLFQPQDEIPKDFYAEKPITISLGWRLPRNCQLCVGYCGIAAHRDPSRHEHITPDDPEDFDRLTMQVTAKTYRYLEQEDRLIDARWSTYRILVQSRF